jgi:hypothetical protein
VDEVNTAAYHLWWVLRQQADCLEGVAPAQMNEAPTSGANSPAAVVAHTMAVTRVFVLGFVCGRDVTRDRPAEFRASFASAAAAQVELRALALELVGALRPLPPAA